MPGLGHATKKTLRPLMGRKKKRNKGKGAETWPETLITEEEEPNIVN